MAYINGKGILFSAKVVKTTGGITPTGTLDIVTNGVYDVTRYESMNVNVAGGSGEAIPEYDGTVVIS